MISRYNYNSLDEYEGELLVMMNDSSSNKYLGKEFKVIQDTLYVFFSPKMLRSGLIVEPDPFIKIPIEDIAYFEIQTYDPGKTCLWGSGIGLGIGLIILVVFIVPFSDAEW